MENVNTNEERIFNALERIGKKVVRQARERLQMDGRLPGALRIRRRSLSLHLHGCNVSRNVLFHQTH